MLSPDNTRERTAPSGTLRLLSRQWELTGTARQTARVEDCSLFQRRVEQRDTTAGHYPGVEALRVDKNSGGLLLRGLALPSSAASGQRHVPWRAAAHQPLILPQYHRNAGGQPSPRCASAAPHGSGMA